MKRSMFQITSITIVLSAFKAIITLKLNHNMTILRLPGLNPNKLAGLFLVIVTLSGSLDLVCAQSVPPGSSGSVGSPGTTNSKEITNTGTKTPIITKSSADELTYVANAESCTQKALNLGADHGPKATTSSWINSQRISECYSRVR